MSWDKNFVLPYIKFLCLPDKNFDLESSHEKDCATLSHSHFSENFL